MVVDLIITALFVNALVMARLVYMQVAKNLYDLSQLKGKKSDVSGNRTA